MTQQHPITPPPELMHNLGNDTALTWLERLERAYQLGADQELEACCEYLQSEIGPREVAHFLAARRPKPPSLKPMTDTNPRDLIRRLADIADALDGRKPLVSAQGQAMDGFTALASFRALADEARAYLAQPEPPSLKEQALALIDGCTDPEGDYLDDNALSIIRRALEALPE